MSDLTGKIISGGSGAGTANLSYAVSELIAQNGKTFLYKATQAGTNQEVFIKIFELDEVKPEIAQKICSQFEMEAQILVELSHPNIADATDYGFYQENPFLVMKSIQGKTIEHRLGKPVPTGESAKILGAISRAYNYTNKKGVSLRDIHPGNIWINHVGESILTAYSPPSPAEVSKSNEPEASSALFTRPDYVAPEQWSGKVSEQSDVYSTGVVTYELVTGQKLFRQTTPESIIQEQAEIAAPQPKQFVPDLSEDMQRVINNSLAVDLAERFSDGAKMAIVFERVSHRETNWYTDQVKEAESVKKKPKSSLMWIVIGAAAVVVVVIILLIATRKPAEQPVAEATQPPAATSEVVSGETSEPSGEATEKPTADFQPTKESSAGVLVGDVYVGSQEEAIQAFESGVSTLGSLFVENGSNTPENFSIALEISQPLLWVTTWCATTEEILDQNLDNITYSFTINGLPVNAANIVERHYVRDSDQLQCADKIILVDQFQPGREKLVLKQVSLMVINNGLEDTPPRQYYERITIEVSE